jgi:transcriptional regulator with XRE-family HTH domain
VLRLRYERTSRRLSQQAVAALSRIPQPAVSAIERGRFKPSPEQLQRLAEVFRVSPDDLLRDVAVLGPAR